MAGKTLSLIKLQKDKDKENNSDSNKSTASSNGTKKETNADKLINNTASSNKNNTSTSSGGRIVSGDNSQNRKANAATPAGMANNAAGTNKTNNAAATVLNKGTNKETAAAGNQVTSGLLSGSIKGLTNADKLLNKSNTKTTKTTGSTETTKSTGTTGSGNIPKFYSATDKRIYEDLYNAFYNPSDYRDYQGVSSDYFARKNYGLNRTTDVRQMSGEQVGMLQKNLQASVAEAKKKEENFQNLSEEEKQALKDEVVATDVEAGRYTHLSAEGLPYMEVNGNLYPIGLNEEQAATGYFKARPSDYYDGNNRDTYDRIAYDYMNGIGSYDEYIWNMETNEDAENLDKYMDDFWNRLETGGFTQLASETRDLMYQKDREASGDYGILTKERELKKADAEIERQNLIREYEENAPESNYVFDPKDIEALGITENDMGELFFANKADEVFYYEHRLLDENLSDKEKYDLIRPEQFMTPEQVYTFDSYYKNGQIKEALAYYEQIEPYLRQMELYAKGEYEQDLTRAGDVSMYLRKIISQPVGNAISTIGAVGGGLFGVEEWQDKDAPIYDLTRTNMNIQTGSVQAVGDLFVNLFGEDARGIGEKVGELGWSVLDNAERQLITAGMSNLFGVPMDSSFAKAFDFLMLGNDVMANTMLTELMNDRSPEEAFIRSLGGAAIEIITENMWWDDLFSPKGMSTSKQAAINYLKSSFLSESAEEGTGFVLDTIFDEAVSWLFDHPSELSEKKTQYEYDLYRQYVNQEHMDPEEARTLAEQEAKKKVMTEWFEDFGFAYMSGGVSAVLSGGARTGAEYVRTRRSDAKTGGDILAYGINADAADNKTRMATEATNEFTIMELGEGFRKGTLTYQIATKMREDVRKGRGINKADVGELARSIVRESNEQVGNAARNILGNTFQAELQEKGVAAEDAPEISNAIVDLIVDGNTKSLATIAASKAAQEIVADYQMGKYNSEVENIKTQTAAERAASKSVMEMLPQASDAKATTDSVRNTLAGATTATVNEIKAAEGVRTGNATETISEGKISDIAGLALKQVEVETEGENGKTSQQMRWQVTMSDGRVVDIADVKATNVNVAQTLHFLQNDSGQVIGQNLADAIMKIATTEKIATSKTDMATTLSGAVQIMWAAATEQKIPQVTGLSTAARDVLVNAVQTDLEESEKKRTVEFTMIDIGKGTTTLNGVSYGSNAFNEMVNRVVRENNLGNNVKTEAQVIGAIAKTVGAQVELYYDAEDTANQGMFTAGGGIRINLAGTTNREGAHRSALATFAHEVTHNIEANSPEAYKALRSFVFTSLGNKLNIQSELKRIQLSYAHYGENLTIAGAISELVAKASETVLTDESVIRQLQEQDPDLAGTVGDEVNELVKRVQSIKGDALTSASMYARAMGDVSRGLSQAWMGAYKEAAAATGTTQANGKTQNAFREIPIDEESIRKNQIEVSQMEAIKADNSKLLSMGTNLFKKVRALFSKPNNIVQSKVFGSVEFSNRKISDSFGHGMTPLKAATYALLPDVIGQGNVISYVEKFEDDNFDSAIVAAPVEITDGPLKGEYYIGAVIKLFKDGSNKYYTHDGIVAIKNMSDGTTTVFDPDSTASVTKKQEYTGSNKGGNHRTIESVLEELPKRNGKSGNLNNSKENLGKVQNSISDEAYLDAVRAGDMDRAQWIVNQMAEAAGYDIENIAYHGTDRFGFTKFDLKKGQNTIFVSYKKEVAGTYTNTKKIREVKDGPKGPDLRKMSDDELAEFAKEKLDKLLGYEVINIEKDEEASGELFTFYTIEGINPDTNEAEIFIDDRGDIEAALTEKLYPDREYQGIYELFTRPGRQLVVDAKGSPWNAIEFEPYDMWDNVSSYDFWSGEEPNIESWTTREIAKWAYDHGYDSVRINNLNDSGGKHEKLSEGFGDIGIFFNEGDVKSADTITYDDYGDIIKPSERFRPVNKDIRYSISDNENENEITNSDGEVMAEVLTGGTVTMYSLRTWEDTDLKELAEELIARGFKTKDVSKWIRDVNGIAAMIAADRDRLDYQATDGVMLKNNQEYIKTLDGSTLCAKRLLYQGIYNEIQHMMPNTPLMPEDLINLINMMKKGGLVTPCGFCYVESRRRMLGKYADEWLKTYDGAYKPTLEEVTTTDGLERLRQFQEGTPQRQAYDDFVAAMNKKGSANPKVVQLRTDYKPREIRNMTDSQIQKVKDIGGLRIQSFSDFEVVHLIDMMQAVLDMAAMDLTSQAYTKVPEFAWVFGGTGIKINLSVIGKGNGIDANGNLIFDDVEGMPFEQAMKLRQAYSENVGTILVGMNDEHIIAAMGDDRIDFIIPFHKSGWSKRELGQVIGLSSYKDYTRWQNEKLIESRKENGKGYKTVPNKKSHLSNLTPVGKEGYWNFSKDGIWNAEHYLQICKEQNRMPKFANFLIDNGDGSFRLPTETEAAGNKKLANIRKGYWKLLIDFKMYDNEGNGAPQQTVKPTFNMERARDILNNYEGGANSLPTNHAIAQQFVEEYKKTHRRRQYSVQDEMDYDVSSWMETVPEWSLKTEAEKTLLQDFKSLRMKMQLDRERESQTLADIRKLEELLAGPGEGSVTRPETMENALEAAGIQIKPADPQKVLSNPTLIKNGKTIGFLYGNDRVRVSNKADPAIFEEIGFAVDRKTKIATYVNPEGNQMGNTATKKKLEALKIKLQNIRNTQEQTREKLAQITGNEGFGGMMYRQQQVLNDLLYNKTQGEVQDSVERMQARADAVARTIEQNQKTIAEMEKGGIVQKLKEILGTTTAEQAVRELKQMTNSTWTRNEITPLFNEIVLKMSQGQDYQQEIENLAGILVNSSRDNAELDEDLSALRGMTLVISEGQLKELRGQGSSLKEIRQRLAGTGITVKTGEYSSLTDNLDDTIAEYGPALFQDLGDEKDAVENFVTRVEQRRNDAIRSNMYAERLANTMAQIAAKAAGVAQGIYMPSDPTAQKQVLAMIDFVKGLAAQTQQAQKTLQGIADEMAAIRKEGKQASGMTGSLIRDVNVALDYYSRINQVAQQSARNQRQQAIIEQLKSKQAEKILKNNEEWRQLIARDRQARQQTEENAKTRGKINTVVKRMYNLLKNPKGTTNIPESMQGIARTVLEAIVGNDLSGLKLTRVAAKDLAEINRVLRAWTERDGAPTMPTAGEISDDASLEIIEQDVQTIRDGISQYNADIRGANKVETLKQRGEILKGIQEALSEIYTRIRTENEVFVRGRQVQVANAAADVLEGTDGKDFREWSGFFGRKLAALHKMIVSGNMTPEYFFRTLSNNGLTALWGNYHDAENRNGLELAKSKERMAEIADQYGFSNWDMKTRQTVKLASGDVQMTLGQIMSLWATWNRELQLGPEMSSHLTSGGFYTEEQDLRDGLLGRTAVQKKAHRVTAEDMANVEGMLTPEQKDFVNTVVRYMSNDMSELGNEASMAAYGIKMYKEKYYFPMQMWDGIKSRKSNDAAQGANVDRAFHPSFSKSRTHGANNALVIGDFMQVATDHIAGMINYATMGLANESMQKVLNYTLTEGENAEEATKRNVRARLEEAYGQEMMQYLMELQKQLNGGAVRTSKTLGDKAITLFRKNAVAGSLSVALQQPLSYIRAGMMINPKYLAAALSPTNWKGSYKEMMKYSGVAVIKDMGRFDMNAGQSAREYLMPDEKESTGRKVWNKFEEATTILPELMDRMTWTRMWSAVKAEQKAKHPGMNATSEEFLTMCGEQFNDLMRRTQVYDSVLVKSANMRNDNYWVKSLTSFMAEPTLTLNVLADAVRAAKTGETGGKGLLVKAGATFLLSAVMQAAVKGLMGSGRNPDDKKNFEENFLYRFFSALISEADPLQLIPGFNDVVTLLKGGELEDDAMGAVGKIVTAFSKTKDVLTGQNSKGWYRDIEDSVGQLAQLFTNVPVKNLMRDGRAMYNFVTQPYAQRATSGDVVANQTADLFWNADNFIGVINNWLGDAGYKTDNAAYKKRVYEAMRDGNEDAAQNYIDYLLNGKGVKSEKSIMTGTKSVTSYTLEDYQAGNITRTRADELLKIANPNMKDQDRAKKLDEIDYETKTGKEVESYSLYTPLFDAMDSGNTSEIDEQKKHLAEVGVKESTITGQMKSHIKSQYEEGKITRTQAEEQYKKYAPTMKQQDIAKALDEVDYEAKTGTDVENYSLYTPLFDAMDQGNASAIDEQKKYLAEVGVKENTIASNIKSHIKGRYEAGEITRTQAEELYKKYAPNMKKSDIIKALDEIDYEKETGEDVDSYSLYTRIYGAIDKGDAATIKSQKSYLKSIGIDEKDVNSQISSYIGSQYKDGKMTRTDAESKLKSYAGLDANDAFWTLDRIDYKKQTGKDAGSGKYYRLWNAMDANKATDIQSAIKTMTSHGVEAKNIKSQISSQYKKQYLAANDSGKTKIRDAMNKAYKALGYSESDVNKVIKKWK